MFIRVTSLDQPTSEVVRVRGAESQVLPLVLDSPHSGTDYPQDFDHQAEPAKLRSAEDTHVHELFEGVLDQGAILVDALFPRSYIDPNRAKTDFLPADLAAGDAIELPFALAPTVKSELGIGLVWMRVPPDGEPMYPRLLTAATLLQRLTAYHQPYHDALRRCLDQTHLTFGRVFHINCHSMANKASAMSAQPRGTPRPDFVIGDRDGTSCDPALTQALYQALTGEGFQVTVNDPYKGAELIQAWSNPANLRHSIQLEINRSLYMDEASREKNANFRALQDSLMRTIKVLTVIMGEAGEPADTVRSLADRAESGT